MSFTTFEFHLLLDEVAARPKSSNLFFSVFSNFTFSFVTKTELDLFFNFLVFTLYDFHMLIIEQNDIIKFKSNFTSSCLHLLYNPGCYFKMSSHFNLLSSHSYIAPLKGFFD